MRLTYVDSSLSELNSTKFGTVTELNSTKFGTPNSTKNGTLKQYQIWDTESKRGNLKEEPKDLFSSLPNDLVNSAREDAWSESEKPDISTSQAETVLLELPSPHLGDTKSDKETKNMAEYYAGPFDHHQTALKRTQRPLKGAIATRPTPSHTPTVSEQLNALQGVNANFEAFWAIYPIKKNKAIAKNAWECQGCDAHVAEIINKLQQQIKRDKQYLEGYAPQPQNYIYREGWLDEIQEVKREGQKQGGYFDYDSTDWIKNIDSKEILK